MIKVERDGKKRYVKCKKCESVLSFNDSDVNNNYDNYRDYLWYESYIICPSCKNKVIIKIEEENKIVDYSKEDIEEV